MSINKHFVNGNCHSKKVEECKKISGEYFFSGASILYSFDTDKVSFVAYIKKDDESYVEYLCDDNDPLSCSNSYKRTFDMCGDYKIVWEYCEGDKEQGHVQEFIVSPLNPVDFCPDDSLDFEEICLRRVGDDTSSVIHGFVKVNDRVDGNIDISIWDSKGVRLGIDDYEIVTCYVQSDISYILKSAGDQDVFGDGENGSLSAIPEDANSALVHVWDAPVIYTVNGDTPATHIGHRVNDGGWIRLEDRQEIDSFQFTNLYAGKIPTLYVHYRT